nr:8757_t:CDS:2 [Entrophospora candida]
MEKYRTALETLNENDNIEYSKDDIEFLFERDLLSPEIIDEQKNPQAIINATHCQFYKCETLIPKLKYGIPGWAKNELDNLSTQ